MKPGSSLLRPVPEGGPTIKFQTLKPMDYPTPYEAMLANGVQFSALDKRHGAFFSIMVDTLPSCQGEGSVRGCVVSCSVIGPADLGILSCNRTTMLLPLGIVRLWDQRACGSLKLLGSCVGVDRLCLATIGLTLECAPCRPYTSLTTDAFLKAA